MNWIDLGILTIVATAAYRGYRTGIIRQVVSVVALAVALLFCSKLAILIEPFIHSYFEVSPRLLRTLTLSLSFILIVLSVRLAGRWIERVLSFSLIKLFNRFMGAVVAPLIYLTLLSILFLLVDTIFPPIQATASPYDIRRESRFYEPVKSIVPTTLRLTKSDLYPIG